MFDTFTQKFPRDYTAAYTISLVDLQAHSVDLNCHELAQIYENDNSNDKNYYDTLINANTL